jgi:type 1 fimbriae regulatory protein FimE
MQAARGNRNGHRDATMILVTYRHRLRRQEVCQLRWDQYDLKRGTGRIPSETRTLS